MTFGPPAAAEEIGGPLGDIEWGDDPDTVVQKVRKQRMEALKKRDDLRRDRVKLQEERKKVVDQTKKFKGTLQELGDSSDFRVSVIADEYDPEADQSVMRYKDEVAQRYYLFDGDEFFKMVIAYKENYLSGVDFTTFVDKTASRYGEPGRRTKGTVKDEEKLVRAEWKDDQTVMRVDNKKDFYNTFTMTFADRKVEKKMREKGVGTKQSDDDEVSSRVRSLTDPSGSEGDDDAVDSIVGESEVDLSEGRPPGADKEDEIEREIKDGEDGESGETDGAQAQKESESDESDEDEGSDGVEKTEESDRDFGDIDSSSAEEEDDDDLIIY
ncbi:MAG: hypothetical protein ACOCV2_09320 [Persicimonas sp.]